MRYFSARRHSEDGKPVRHIWLMEGEESAALVNLDAGTIDGFIWHDGYGKYFPTVYVSPFVGWQLIRNHDGILVSLRSFPRVAVELIRTISMVDACADVNAVFGEP
jgi:hypothetical protein